MKRLLLGILSIVLLISCTVKSETPTDTEQTVLKIGAIKDFKRSLEGSTLVFDTLLQMTLDYKPLPNIITEWTRNDTATEYHLTIRDDILFSDGTPLTAQTVKWDIENVAPITYCVFSSLLKEVSITDTTHLKISLPAPYYFLPQDLALVTAIKEKGVDEALNITDFIGTGAYILKEYDEGQSASLIKNENYWNKAAAPSIPQVEWLVITDDNARNSALSSGQIDVLGISEHYLSIQYPLIDDLIKAKKMSFFEEPKDAFTSLMTISFNWKEGFCSDKALREALEYGINRQALVDTVFFGIPQASGHQFNPAFTDGPQNEKPYTYNPEFSKTLLAEAGYRDSDSDGVLEKDGKKVSLKFLISSKEDYQRDLAVFIKSELHKLRIDCEIIQVTGESMREHFKTGNYDLAVSHPWYEPIIGTVTYFGFDDNYTDYGLSYAINTKSVEAARALVESATEEQIKTYAGALWKEQYEQCVTLPLCTSSRMAIFNPRFEGFRFNGNVYRIDLSGVKLRTEKR